MTSPCPTAGDELVKLWRPTTSDLLPVATLTSDCDAVLTLAVRDNTLFAGHQGGAIKVRANAHPARPRSKRLS